MQLWLNVGGGTCGPTSAMRQIRPTATPCPSLTLESLIALGPLSKRDAPTARELAELVDALESGLLMESGIYELTEADLIAIAA